MIWPRCREYSSSNTRWLRGSARSPSAVKTCVMVALSSSNTINAITVTDIRRREAFIRVR
ncbi:Uncharacterised protein [Mycobacterium tuberculosis]|uniref:Uncharacterized protein n=1 Tax=Mycobacterium tuberculosis TaxID=1773 RepID=A0A916LCX4_MYCTX|nr:Uncharacterised protein [Mycobacterium tuberculosis]CPA50431.1 Uncharacterised protein [Mycobacterium tuberculosis]